MVCSNCSGCIFEGICLEYGLRIGDYLRLTPQLCNKAGGIDCSGKLVFVIISIRGASITQIPELSLIT